MSDQEDAFTTALRSEDEVGAVIRAHLYIESTVNSILEACLPYPEHLLDARLGFNQKVQLLLAVGLRPQYRPPLEILGKIRNHFAHNPEAALLNRLVTDLYGAFHPEDRKILLDGYRQTNANLKKKNAPEFKHLPHKDRFVLIMHALRALLLAAEKEVTVGRAGT